MYNLDLESSSVNLLAFPKMGINNLRSRPNGNLYLVNYIGLFYSSDNGSSWKSIKFDPNIHINDFDFDDKGFMLLATDEGIFKSDKALY